MKSVLNVSGWAGVTALLIAAGAARGDIVSVSQSRTLTTHASGVSQPPDPSPEDQDAAEATAFKPFQAAITSTANGTISRASAGANQDSTIDAAGASASGGSTVRADSLVFSSPAIADGTSVFEYVFDVTAAGRFTISGAVSTTDDFPAQTPLTTSTMSAVIRLSVDGGATLAEATANRTNRNDSIDTVLVLQPGRYRLVASATNALTTLSAPLPAMNATVEYDLAFGEAPCLADFNGDGTPNSGDFFDYLTAFFALDASADVNGDDAVTSQDFFDFLAAFFEGCGG